MFRRRKKKKLAFDGNTYQVYSRKAGGGGGLDDKAVGPAGVGEVQPREANDRYKLAGKRCSVRCSL